MATARAEDHSAKAFSLDRHRRRQLLSGDYRALVFAGTDKDPKPDGCEPGARYVLTWTHGQRSRVGDVVVDVPRRPSCFIVVTDVRRHRKGGWMVRFNVVDHRERIRYLRRTPPVMDPHDDDGVEAESSYTTSRWRAVDDLEVVPDQWLRRRSKAAFDRDHHLRLVATAERNRQMWRRKRKRDTSTLVAA